MKLNHLFLMTCASGILMQGAKCSREHVQSVEMMNSCVENHQRKLYPQAIKDCSKAVSLEPDNDLALHSLALIYMDTKEYEQAARNLQKAISVNDKVAIYHYRLGEVFQEIGQLEQAVTEYKRAIELDDTLFKAHYKLGLVYQDMDNPQDALQKYTDTLKRNARFFEAYRELGALYADYDFTSQAEQVFDEALKALEGRDKELAVIYQLKGTVLLEKKQYDAAIESFKKAIELKPGMDDALFSLGWAYSYVNVENAKVWLRKFLESATTKTRSDYVEAAQARLTEIEIGTPVQ